eukprot:357274-Chlamydomonas_euryale.AAC.9
MQDSRVLALTEAWCLTCASALQARALRSLPPLSEPGLGLSALCNAVVTAIGGGTVAEVQARVMGDTGTTAACCSEHAGSGDVSHACHEQQTLLQQRDRQLQQLQQAHDVLEEQLRVALRHGRPGVHSMATHAAKLTGPLGGVDQNGPDSSGRLLLRSLRGAGGPSSSWATGAKSAGGLASVSNGSVGNNASDSGDAWQLRMRDEYKRMLQDLKVGSRVAGQPTMGGGQGRPKGGHKDASSGRTKMPAVRGSGCRARSRMALQCVQNLSC